MKIGNAKVFQDLQKSSFIFMSASLLLIYHICYMSNKASDANILSKNLASVIFDIDQVDHIIDIVGMRSYY